MIIDPIKQMQDEQVMIQQAFSEVLDVYTHSPHRQKVEIIQKAFEFANEAHRGIRRRSGEPYIMHPIAVAKIVAQEIGLGSTSICAALLHDVVEDTDFTVEDIENQFNKRIAIIVDGLTKISGGVFAERVSEQAENFRKLLLTMSEDIRVILIKIADRLHNMRTLGSMPPAKQYKIAGETLYIYAPLANRLGLFSIKSELENLSFKYEHPETFAEITALIEAESAEHEQVYSEFKTPIEAKLKALGFTAELKERVKTVYSVWHKMQTKNIPFEEVYDLLALRIVFEPKPEMTEQEQCWIIYSAITQIYRPHPERIRDWVSTPKANGYSALHVTVMGPHGRWIEVQIRSTHMNEVAEKGLAAHWKYKTGEQRDDETELDKWLKELKEELKNPTPSAVDFMDNVKLNLFASEIFVFTPKGEIKTIPQGATALDFAFLLHSDLGFKCIGAKVNHKLVPLSHVLASGDQVEILTAKMQKPQADWLRFVVTARAKTKLETALKKELTSVSQTGQKNIEEELKKVSLAPTPDTIQRLVEYYKLADKKELYRQAGKNYIDLTDISKKIFKPRQPNLLKKFVTLQFGSSENKKGKDEEETTVSAHKVDRKKTFRLTDEKSGKSFRIAPCCQPIPGDDVFGYVDEDEVVIVHKRQCPEALKLKASHGERIVTAEWAMHKELSFAVTVEMNGIDRIGMLREISRVVTDEYSINIQSINIETKDGIFYGRLHLYVYGTEQVNNLCMKLLKIKGMSSVKRVEA
ncbi:RelA/SpoT family protein [Paludibacter sp.]|uniref:RelA/SpoT family protein n=1 Tax=Paludibacter sp. TaxID=1898105 RepID=UPI001353058C|nr:RelA/SpoT family protein [Paludibacter sp.]MTK52582.1 bifunctional (p)ppGpp synthetase/guanosine-3',5'-bis(diphosphate) 3'-pyrophosphohydrolase [Paludibacter sp.]